MMGLKQRIINLGCLVSALTILCSCSIIEKNRDREMSPEAKSIFYNMLIKKGVDTSEDKRISAKEYLAEVKKTITYEGEIREARKCFNRIDTNGDGYLDEEDF